MLSKNVKTYITSILNSVAIYVFIYFGNCLSEEIKIEQTEVIVASVEFFKVANVLGCI